MVFNSKSVTKTWEKLTGTATEQKRQNFYALWTSSDFFLHKQGCKHRELFQF
jgi:hypothetical protein